MQTLSGFKKAFLLFGMFAILQCCCCVIPIRWRVRRPSFNQAPPVLPVHRASEVSDAASEVTAVEEPSRSALASGKGSQPEPVQLETGELLLPAPSPDQAWMGSP